MLGRLVLRALNYAIEILCRVYLVISNQYVEYTVHQSPVISEGQDEQPTFPKNVLIVLTGSPPANPRINRINFECWRKIAADCGGELNIICRDSRIAELFERASLYPQISPATTALGNLAYELAFASKYSQKYEYDYVIKIRADLTFINTDGFWALLRRAVAFKGWTFCGQHLTGIRRCYTDFIFGAPAKYFEKSFSECLVGYYSSQLFAEQWVNFWIFGKNLGLDHPNYDYVGDTTIRPLLLSTSEYGIIWGKYNHRSIEHWSAPGEKRLYDTK